MSSVYIEQAVELALQANGHTSPNPMVGAILVKDGSIIGEGSHKKSGTSHAEIIAINQAKERGHSVEGSDLYITLEPCAHYGKTPPCVETLIKERIRSVTIGMEDTFRLVRGKGIESLKSAGINVDVLPVQSVLARKVREINQPFVKWSTTGLPYITMKAAVSLDGKIATTTGESKWITSTAAREDGRRERSLCDAVLVGSGTVKADNPELAAHGEYKKKNLLRVIIDKDLSLPVTHTVFRDKHVFVATTDQATEEQKNVYKKKNIEFASFGANRVSLKHLFQYLGKKGIQHIFVEGGAKVHGELCDLSIVDPLVLDRCVWYIHPSFIGGEKAKSSIEGEGIGSLQERPVFFDIQTSLIGTDIKIVGVRNSY